MMTAWKLLFKKIYEKSDDLQGRIAEIVPAKVCLYEEESIHSDDENYPLQAQNNLEKMSIIGVFDENLYLMKKRRELEYKYDKAHLINPDSMGESPVEIMKKEVKANEMNQVSDEQFEKLLREKMYMEEM